VGRRIYLIDWEYSGMNDSMWDLGNLSVEANFRAQLDQAMMEAYCGGSVPPRLYARVALYKAISDFLWALWSIVQHANGNPAADFWTYALDRFEHCNTLIGSKEFGRHLAAARVGRPQPWFAPLRSVGSVLGTLFKKCQFSDRVLWGDCERADDLPAAKAPRTESRKDRGRERGGYAAERIVRRAGLSQVEARRLAFVDGCGTNTSLVPSTLTHPQATRLG
jgi:hypothetical protein